MGSYYKANLTLVKTHWQHKVVGRQVEIKDGLEARYSNSLTTWIPKLTPKYPKPCAFFHVSNKNSACYFRTNPIVLANTLEDIIVTLRSDKWLDTWDRIQEISENLIDNELFLDENYLDMPLFEKEIQARH